LSLYCVGLLGSTKPLVSLQAKRRLCAVILVNQRGAVFRVEFHTQIVARCFNSNHNAPCALRKLNHNSLTRSRQKNGTKFTLRQRGLQGHKYVPFTYLQTVHRFRRLYCLFQRYTGSPLYVCIQYKYSPIAMSNRLTFHFELQFS
jgi:hypothetical protein